MAGHHHVADRGPGAPRGTGPNQPAATASARVAHPRGLAEHLRPGGHHVGGRRPARRAGSAPAPRRRPAAPRPAAGDRCRGRSGAPPARRAGRGRRSPAAPRPAAARRRSRSSSASSSAAATRHGCRVDPAEVPVPVQVGVVAGDQRRARHRRSAPPASPGPAPPARPRPGSRRRGWRPRSGRCLRTPAGSPPSPPPRRRGPAPAASAPAASGSGSGSSAQSMWVSTRSVPGTRTVKPSTPCAPGAAPLPRLTRLVGVVEGKPGGQRPAAGRGELGQGRRVRGGRRDLVPAEPVDQQHRDPAYAVQLGGQAERVGAARHAEHRQRAGQHVGEAAAVAVAARAGPVRSGTVAHAGRRANRCSWAARSR